MFNIVLMKVQYSSRNVKKNTDLLFDRRVRFLKPLIKSALVAKFNNDTNRFLVVYGISNRLFKVRLIISIGIRCVVITYSNYIWVKRQVSHQFYFV